MISAEVVCTRGGMDKFAQIGKIEGAPTECLNTRPGLPNPTPRGIGMSASHIAPQIANLDSRPPQTRKSVRTVIQGEMKPRQHRRPLKFADSLPPVVRCGHDGKLYVVIFDGLDVVRILAISYRVQNERIVELERAVWGATAIILAAKNTTSL
jgi:hypothetical protein